MEKIKIGEEEVYLRKSFDGWRVIYPIKNEDGSWNYKNLILGGNIWKFLKVLAIILIIIAIIVIYHYDTETCSNTLRHLDEVCSRYQSTFNLTNPDSKLAAGLNYNGTG